VTLETYEQTKRILEARYGDKNRIIQAHLDYLEVLKPTQSERPEALFPPKLNAMAESKLLRHKWKT